MAEMERNPLTVDQCDKWLEVSDRQCDAYWRVEIELTEDTRVQGGSMGGTYRAGVWRFCRMHARIFERDRVK